MRNILYLQFNILFNINYERNIRRIRSSSYNYYCTDHWNSIFLDHFDYGLASREFQEYST